MYVSGKKGKKFHLKNHIKTTHDVDNYINELKSNILKS